MPARASLFRLLSLCAFIAAVAALLFVLDARWWVVVLVMAVAWLIAAGIEWFAWNEPRAAGRSRANAAQPPPEEPAETVAPPEPEPEAAEPEAAEPEVQAEAEAKPEPEREPEPEPEREPERPRPTVVPPPEPAATAPPPAPERSGPPAAPPPVVPMRRRRPGPREWNLWELERLARAGAHRHPERSQEWAYLFVHLRQFANPDGALPAEFDGLVRESFGDLLEASGRA